MFKKIAILIVGLVIVIYGGSYLYGRWENTHAWLFTIIYIEKNGHVQVVDTLVGVDFSLKGLQEEVDNFIEKEKSYPNGARVGSVKYFGKMPLKKMGVWKLADTDIKVSEELLISKKLSNY